MSRNQFLFDAATIARKPHHIQEQLRRFLAPLEQDFPSSHGPTAPKSRRLAKADCAPSRAISKQALCDASVEPAQREMLYPGRVSVRIVSYRRRLLDPDNLCAKWFLDACRYACLIRDDRPQDITFEVAQIKVRSKAEERTEVIITPVSP